MQSHLTVQCWQTVEQVMHTGRSHGPPGLCAFPGHLFSALGAQFVPMFQHIACTEKELEALEVERAPPLGSFARPRLKTDGERAPLTLG